MNENDGFVTFEERIIEDCKKFFGDHQELQAEKWSYAHEVLLVDAPKLVAKYDGDTFAKEMIDVICREIHRGCDWNTRMRNAR